MANSYVSVANKYAKDVVGGKIPGNKYLKLACQRHIDDGKRQGDKAYPYRFDNEAANHVCQIAESLPHTKGKWAKNREDIKLQPWQVFLLCVTFGWKRKRNGMRRFRRVYWKIPRKNGKSVLAAIIAVYMFAFDGEFGAEVYSGATTEKQAWEVFRPAKQMIERTPELCEAINAEVWAKTVVTVDDGSRMEPVIGKPGDGSSPSCAIVDEYHEHDTPDLVDTMETGMGAREQPLLVEITTAGFNISGPCYDQEIEARRMLDGLIENDELFAVLYGIDDDDDWTKPEALIKANPNIGISVDYDFLMSQQRQAVINAGQQTRFKTKHLNIWCSARSAWLQAHSWALCADPMLSIDEFEGQEAWFILDLASRNDICAFVQLFKRRINGQDHFYAFARYYLPEDTVEEAGNNQAAYRRWILQGHLIQTDGAEIDFNFIRDEVMDMAPRFQVREVIYDPWRATMLAQQIASEGATIVEHRQTVQLMSPPMKELASAIKSGRFHHDGNPVTAWMASNVVAKEDAKENIYPRKEKPELKIDGIVALIMGVGRAMSPADVDESIYEERGILTI